MVKKVQEEDSNSQRDNLFIANIDSKQAVQDIIRIELSDSSFFYVSTQFYFDSKLSTNDEISSDIVEQLQLQTEFILCRKKALDLIANREHSSFELKRKLVQRQLARVSVVNEVIALLKEKNYLNDERFTSMFIPYLLQTKKCSRNYIKLKLGEKGIDKCIYQNMLQELYPEERETELATAYFQQQLEKGKAPEKIAMSLNLKGFQSRVIFSVLNKFKRQD